MKIAVAVDTDKKTIVKRTGQAAYFAIYENNKLLDLIENQHGEGNHGKGDPQGGAYHKHELMASHEHTNEHKKDAIGLAGCDVILVQAVGEHMKAALESMGLKVQKIRKKDGVIADEAVRNFLDNNL